MANYWKIVHDVIVESDILIIVADARTPRESVNKEALKKIIGAKKKFMVVFNKYDLLDHDQREELNKVMKEYEFVATVSAINHTGTMALLRKINAIAKGDKATVGIIGYPNTGKSSVINAIKGKKSAPVSSQAGQTKGVQKLRVTKKIVLLDSPGVIPFENKYEQNLHAMIGARSPNQLKDPEGAVLKVIDYLDGKVEKFYGVLPCKTSDLTLDSIAVKLNLKKKGDLPDTIRAAIQILHDWQKGKIN